MKKNIKVLKAARDLLVNKGWCQRNYARDANGFPADLNSPHACSFCMVGALLVATNFKSIQLDDDHPLIQILVSKIPTEYSDIPDFNDDESRTKDEVIAVFDAAIQELENNAH